MNRLLVLAVIAVVMMGGLLPVPVVAKDVLLPVPSRLMWGREPGVPGFCGETSYQMHGIYWGNWISTEYVYRAAGSKELLIDSHLIKDQDIKTAKNLMFTYEKYVNKDPNTNDGARFAAWAKSQIDRGNLIAFGGFEDKPNGLDAYDHIMPIVGYRLSSSKVVKGLWLSTLYEKNLQLVERFETREECTSEEASDPSVWCIPKAENFAIALTGIKDTKKETLRTRLVMPSWTEPDWSEVDGLDETPVPFTVDAVVSGLSVGKRYSILRFSSLASLPSSDFLKSRKYTKRKDFTATATKMTFSKLDTFSSNSTMFFRTVRNTDPVPTTRRPTTRRPTTRRPSTRMPTIRAPRSL